MSLLALVCSVIGVLVLVMAVCGAVFSCLATGVLRAFLRRPVTISPSRPSVTVLRPLHGDEPELYENLASLCDQTYAGAMRLVLGAQSPTDPALDVARRIQAERADIDIVVICDGASHGTNRKISNLINMSRYAHGETIVISDSDVSMPPDGVTKIVAALDDPEIGLVYCLYRGKPTASFWSHLAAMDINTRFAPNVVVGEALGACPCLGPTMALRTEMLAAIGGFEHLSNFLADDFELGRAVREAGYRVACPSMLIDHVFPERSLHEMLTHELRWARTVRLIEPAGYLGSVIVHFTPLAWIGAALTGFGPWAVGLAVALMLVRIGQAYWLSQLMSFERRCLWLTPLRDVLSLAVFLGAIFGDHVEWRGAHMRVRRSGAMVAT